MILKIFLLIAVLNILYFLLNIIGEWVSEQSMPIILFTAICYLVTAVIAIAVVFKITT